MTPPRNTILAGDALTVLRGLPDQCVHMVCTSPPYWALRDYGTAEWDGGDPACEHAAAKMKSRYDYSLASSPIQDGSRTGTDAPRYKDLCPKCGARRVDSQLGLERVHDCAGWATGQRCGECYICRMTAVFAEVRRVLRDDGTAWVNMGDSYNSGAECGRHDARVKKGIGATSKFFGTERQYSKRDTGLKPKDLCMMPARLALSLQADGWWLRSDIVWAKPNPMPESCTDRPTKAHEFIFLLSKSARYYYDAEAVKERNTLAGAKRLAGKPVRLGGRKNSEREDNPFSGVEMNQAVGRNMRSVWTMATAPFAEAHFATFPPELPRKCILAGTSEKGCCPKCGKGWERVVNASTRPEKTSGVARHNADRHDNDRPNGPELAAWRAQHPVRTLGWRPGCACDAGEPVPCLVLDCFMGAGTVGLVAQALGRDYLGIELNPEYIRMAERRIRKYRGLPLEVDDATAAAMMPLFEKETPCPE